MPRPILLSLALAASLCACRAATPPGEGDVPVRVGSVAVDQTNAPVVLLEETDGARVLPIWIGSAEAISIASHMNNEPPPRPNFHDLAQRVIRELDAEVERVVVTELRESTYYATLTLRSGERRIEIDVRPSDGIAVALRARAPILVRASVFESAARSGVVPAGDGQEI
jgi:bifunctional DNase/RNase